VLGRAVMVFNLEFGTGGAQWNTYKESG
jgi:hypothetical protein